jgi:hypothetical protein
MNLREGSIFTLAAIYLAVSTAVVGQQFVNTAQAVRAAADNEVVCRTQARIGSRFHDKTCMTRHQWEHLSQEHQRIFRESNRPPGDQNPTMNR